LRRRSQQSKKAAVVPYPDGSKIVLKLGSQVSGVVETKVWTADTQPVALLATKMIG
jgi:hypothetical protein